jgi:hypothetical protein
MKPQNAEKEFRAFLLRRGTSLERLDPLVGLNAMVAFYREVRGQGLRFEHDEDMLLFQWGCYERNNGVAFDFDITRQLIFDEPEEGSIWQLSLAFHFDPTDDLRALGNSNRWCESLDALPSFEGFLTDHPAVALIANRAPRSRHLYFGTV